MSPGWREVSNLAWIVTGVRPAWRVILISQSAATPEPSLATSLRRRLSAISRATGRLRSTSRIFCLVS